MENKKKPVEVMILGCEGGAIAANLILAMQKLHGDDVILTPIKNIAEARSKVLLTNSIFVVEGPREFKLTATPIFEDPGLGPDMDIYGKMECRKGWKKPH